MRVSVLSVLVALLLAATVRAEPLPGADHPSFRSARAAWLAGEDMQALAALSGLAHDGNAAAQLLLGAIEAQRHLVPEAAAALPRAERIALWRAPGGLSVTSWLSARAEDLPLAAALELATYGFGLASDAERGAALETLLEAGEARAAMSLLTTAFNQGGWQPDGGWDLVLRFAAHPALQGHAAVLLAALHGTVTYPGTGFDAHVPTVAVALKAADIPASDLLALPAAMRWQATLAEGGLAAAQEAAGTAPVAEPLRAFCTATCPKSAGACTFGLLAASGGMPGYTTLSPLESAIPTADYRASTRFDGDIRGGIGSHPGTAPDVRAGARALLAQFDACAANALHGAE